MTKRFAAMIGILLMIITAMPVQAAAKGQEAASGAWNNGSTMMLPFVPKENALHLSKRRRRETLYAIMVM